MEHTKLKNNFYDVLNKHFKENLDWNFTFKDQKITDNIRRSEFDEMRILFILLVPISIIIPINLTITSNTTK